MPDQEPRAKRLHGWGALFFSILLIAVVVGVGANADRLATALRKGTAEVSALLALRTAIQDKFEYERVSINMRRHSSSVTKDLGIEISDEAFLDLPEDKMTSQAKSIAVFVLEQIGSEDRYDQIVVVAKESRGTVVTFSSKREFPFTPAELK